jgi:hypothetical protein
MDMNEYVLEILVRDRLTELRAESARARRRRSASVLRVALGHALVRLGERLRPGGGAQAVIRRRRGRSLTRPAEVMTVRNTGRWL